MNCPVRFAAWLPAVLLATMLLAAGFEARAQKVPHGQDKPPGPPLSPAEALAKMTVPEGFSVELVAAEPDLVNPVAMTFDERGRIWVTESLEYPRHEPGPGRDRVKILEDTNRDGRVDKATIFLEGLNIPSGIAVGHGGVWIANSPDILFVQDTDGDGKADRQEVVVTGFGRTDTHELPNSLTWGPDGWLYGLNGVFNHSHVKYPDGSPLVKTKPDGWQFTCAMFRIHPRTRAFEVFAEGTSNPWGIAFNNEGSAFVSACVIDHLWHIVETGYYHRQAGAYPANTWKIESIVKHKHQKAAYCGLHFFDSDAYPEKYREKLYMGNIHGACLNVDRLERAGSTYAASAEPDFLTANDAWFMPVAQKTGPDGCLYVLDWYDQYHCYQDANRDPAGIERAKGRLYRVRYKGTPRAPAFDLSKESDEQLVRRLASPNVYFRDLAQRILAERNTPPIVQRLLAIVKDKQAPPKQRRHAMFALSGCDLRQHKLEWEIPSGLLDEDEAWIRAAALRTASVHYLPHVRAPEGVELAEAHFASLVTAGLEDDAEEVRLQALILVGKLALANRTYVAYDDQVAAALLKGPQDPLLMRIAWQSLRFYQERHPTGAVTFSRHAKILESPAGRELVPRMVDLAVTNRRADARTLKELLETLLSTNADAGLRNVVLQKIAAKLQSGEISGERLAMMREVLTPPLNALLGKAATPLENADAVLLAATLKIPAGYAGAHAILKSAQAKDDQRLAALGALVTADDSQTLDAAAKLLSSKDAREKSMHGQVLALLGRMDNPQVAQVVLAAYSGFDPDIQPKAIEVLTQRASWAKLMLAAIGEKRIPVEALNVNQVRKLLASRDPELTSAVQKQWGTIRDERSPARDAVIGEMRGLLRRVPGDAHRGKDVFHRVCGQCHKIHGEGQEVGPDITLNGRNAFDQLLSNVFDPSLVIGAAYQARTVVTTEGRVISGLVAEEGTERLVLKVQGGKQEVIPTNQIDEMKVSELSLMPEDLEKTLKAQEIADLFAFITLDKLPSDPTAKRLPGVYDVLARQTSEPAQFAGILAEVAPGFVTEAVGEGGLALLKSHYGRPAVVRSHPVDRETPCVLTRTVDLPADKKSKLLVSVSHDPRGDWQLVVKANGKTLYSDDINQQSTEEDWEDLSLDLSEFAGKQVTLELHNHPNNWSFEFAYWGRVEIASEE